MSRSISNSAFKIQFDVYNFDLRTGELWKHGLPVRLQQQPARILRLLVSRPGELVSRDEIRRELWPDDVFVDHEHGLHRAINKLREALSDTAAEPRFMETRARAGYRFIAPVFPANEPPTQGPVVGSEPKIGETRPTAAVPSDRHPGALTPQLSAVAPRHLLGAVFRSVSPSAAGIEVPSPPAQPNRVEERTGGLQETRADSLQIPPDTLRQSSWLTRQRRWLAAGVLLAGVAVASFILRGVSPTKDAARVSAGPVRLAVLPFVNLTGHPDQEYLCDGLTEEMITVLGGLSPGRLAVIARTSSMTFKNSNRTAAEIGRSLKVNYVLECSVREATNRLRINAQLVRTSDEVHVWTQEYDREMRDLLNVQGEVARAIAEEIEARLSPGKQTRLASVHPIDPKVHELYLRGRYYWNKRTPDTLKKSIEYFHKAAIQDPSYAPAYAGLADSYAMLGSAYYPVLPPREAYPRAEAAAMKALELDPNQAEPHAALAWSKTVFDWDWQGADREFKRAIELNPDNANVHHWYGYYLLVMGRLTDGVAEYRTAQSLDPLSLIINADLGQEALAAVGQYDEEMEQCRRTLELDANFAEAHVCMMNSYEQRGMHQEAIKQIREAIRLSRDNLAYIAALGLEYSEVGRRVEVVNILNDLKARSKHEYVPSGLFFQLCSALGEKDEAIAWLEKAYQEHDAVMLNVREVSPRNPVRSDPRFQDLLRRMNFPP